MKKDKVLKIIDLGILISVIIICGIVLFMGLFGFDEMFGKQISYAYISCVLLCAIAVHFVLSNLYSLEQDIMKESVSSIVESLNGVEKKKFNTITEVDNYVAQRIHSAKISVQDLNWQDFRLPSASNSQQNRKITDDEIDVSIKSFCSRRRNKQEINKSIYEEIFTFPPSNRINLAKIKKHVEYGKIYCCSYYETLEELKFPKLQFVIIDSSEVIFVSSEYKGNFCAVKDKRIVNICSNYFMQARELSIMIKEKCEPANLDLIDKIENKYK